MGRSSAIGTVLPAILSLLGALAIYVFGADNKHRVLISYCICLFAAMLFYGTQYGAYKRDLDQEYRLRQLIKTEARLKTIRRNLGLRGRLPNLDCWRGTEVRRMRLRVVKTGTRASRSFKRQTRKAQSAVLVPPFFVTPALFGTDAMARRVALIDTAQ